ncbi:MAG: DUF996 domain-containing protein [Pyrobaculum sp.]
MEFDSAKSFYAVGLLLTILGLGVIGVLLMLIGLYSLSRHYSRSTIFTNALYAVIISAVGALAAVATLFIFYPAYLRYVGWETFFALPMVWLVLSVFIAAAAYFMKKSFAELYEVSKVELFKTAATLTLIGGLTAVVFVGYIILLIAFILATIAAFSLKPQQAGALEF